MVIGGGLLGLEAANGLHLRGMHVTVVHLLDTLMERQLDAPAGALLKAALEKRGIEFRMRAKTAGIVGDERVRARALRGRQEIVPADLVVMAVGVRPNIELAKRADLACDRGILVDDTLQTYDPAIYAVGECVQHRRQTFGLVAPLWEQARICAQHIAEIGVSRFSRRAQRHAAQGDRHRGVLGRRLLREGEPRIAGALRQAPRRLQAHRARGQQDLRRRAVRRHARSGASCAS